VKRLGAGLWLLCCAVGCGPALQPRAAEPVLELTLARPDGSSAELTSLQHQPTLLFMFATYDATSQFALAPLQRFLEQEKRIDVIGIALQPDAKAFLDLYQRSLDLPFALYYDPGNVLLQGQTALGRVRAVPSFVALDGGGHIRRQHVGIASAEQLRALAESALDD
jgi:hypothetical protein